MSSEIKLFSITSLSKLSFFVFNPVTLLPLLLTLTSGVEVSEFWSSVHRDHLIPMYAFYFFFCVIPLAHKSGINKCKKKKS